MLEIRNVTKIYHSKNGNAVKALDNISMTFPETGMVFILGKSGSGKSTLLNVIGGLDGYDSGEFIIKGKSSKEFGASDFDAYRNTFIGFIFQEYNILDDFTVGANIGLALELQGKKATNEKISGILEQVEMLEYAKRKPNELSGGQKQRIAIARALVKDPEIIMADEPTGALDSNTGKQIFDTLKELSKTKLVIIVSHDRDFAEQYGDRIIEMKDGNILSDITKHRVAAKTVSSGILQMNDNLLRIEKGYQLTAKDLELINEYLREQPAEILVSGDRRVNDGVRNTAGISADNTSSVFKDTDEKEDVKVKTYDKKNTKFIRSRLPFKNAFKIGSSSLGHKKFRLTVTIFLSLIAFALSGFADTLGAYNKVVAATDSIIDSNVKNASFSLSLKHTWSYADGDSNYSYYSTAMNDDDIKMLRDRTGLNFIPVFNGTAGENWGGNKINLTGMMLSNDKIASGTAYTGELYGFTSLSDQDVTSLNFTLTGAMPSAKDEIVITKHVCDQFNVSGFANSRYNEKISAGALQIDAAGGANSIIGKHLTVQMMGMSYDFVVSGVVDTMFDTERYADYIPGENAIQKNPEDIDIMGMMMEKELENTLEYGFHGLGYIHQEKLDEMANNMMYNLGSMSSVGSYMNNWNIIVKKPFDNGEKSLSSSVIVGMPEGDMFISEGQHLLNLYRVGTSADIPAVGEVFWFDGRTSNTLAANEILVHESVFNNISSDANVTQKVKDILVDIYGKSAPEATENTYQLSSLIRELEAEKYVNDWLETEFAKAEVKAELAAKWLEYERGIPAGAEINPDDESLKYTDEDLKNFFRIKYVNGETYCLPEGVTDSWELFGTGARRFAREFFGKDFLNTALGKESFSDEYDVQFFIDLLNEVINTREDGCYIYEDGVRNLIVYDYAYTKVLADEAFYTSDEFLDAVVSKMYGETLPDDFVISKYEAARAYGSYILNYTYEDMPEVFGDKRRSDFDSIATDSFKVISGFNPASAVTDMYLERRSWDEGGENVEKLSQYKIVGTFGGEGQMSELVISDTMADEYAAYAAEQKMPIEIVAPHDPGIYAFVIAPMPTDRASVQNLVEINYEDGGDYRFNLQNQVTNTLGSFNEFIEIGAKIFLYVGIGFAVFSALMLMNFISVSISYKRREIGILRAVGARSSDVFKIFFSEAFVIALINCVLSIAATVAGTIFFNELVRKEGINVTLLHFGVRQVILMMAISLFVAAIASFFPVWNIARRKPVDAIRNK